MGIDLGIFTTYVGVIVMFFVFGKLFYWPIKVAIRLAVNSVFGAMLLIVINYVGQGFGIFIPINVLNAAIVGILGLPGTIMLLLLTA